MYCWIHKGDSLARSLLKDDIEIRYIEESKKFSPSPVDVLVVPKGDIIASLIENEKSCRVSYYDAYVENVFNHMSGVNTYDYMYLNYHLHNKAVSTVFIGSSYMNFGIDVSLVDKAANLALASQDIYYSVMLAKKLYNHTKYKKVFLGGYYYTIFSDLSMTKDHAELAKISDIYSRIFSGAEGFHHAICLPDRSEPDRVNGIYDKKRIDNYLSKKIFGATDGNYWGSINREMHRMYPKSWGDYTDEEKQELGKWRANCHNKSIRYKSSFKENLDILCAFMTWCETHEIELNIINFPVTKFYRRYFSDEFSQIYYECLERMRMDGLKFNLYDFESVPFDDSDFVDTDHLNDCGARKLTSIILDMARC